MNKKKNSQVCSAKILFENNISYNLYNLIIIIKSIKEQKMCLLKLLVHIYFK